MHQADLFGNSETNTQLFTSAFFLNGEDDVHGGLAKLWENYELSADAYHSALFAMMSELPIEGEIERFIEKVGNCTDRESADRVASNRSDPDTLTVLKAAYKVQHEIHRLTGLLRFNPDSKGTYIARFAPDHFILPALAKHFTHRFGETSWAIIDEKRNLCLYSPKRGEARLIPAAMDFGEEGPALPKDSWEDLWRLYHRSINNESRRNPRLQGQFMPERYRKYLPELQ